MKVSSVTEMRNLDRAAIEEYGISQELLMENAGLAMGSVISKEFGIEGKKFVIFCGQGNNGGDGLVVARKLHSNGGKVKVIILGDPAKFKGAARKNYDIAARLSIEIHLLESAGKIDGDIANCDAIVDAILGTGIIRNIEAPHRNVIESINRSGKKVFSVDIPSGIQGDTGKILGTAVNAHYTVTFGLPKIGNVLFPA